MGNIFRILSAGFLCFLLCMSTSCQDTQVDSTSFIKIREVTLSCPSPSRRFREWRPSITEAIYTKYSMQNWDMPKLRMYIDMLKAFGFNSIELYDNFGAYVNAGWGIDYAPETLLAYRKADPRDWGEKMDALADYARSQGMRTTLFLWANTTLDRRDNTVHYKLEPDNLQDMDILDRYWDYQAAHAPYFDHIVTHWTDPGGCAGDSCTIETAQRLHNEIVRRFRQKNEAIESSFSLWVLDIRKNWKSGATWAGYEDVHTILDSGILPVDVALAMSGYREQFDTNEARAIAASGRKVGIWAWYLADNEIEPSLHVRTSALDAYFKKLPAEAHELLEWHSLDSNNPGLNMQNLYVAGQLMQDPQRDARAALREFISGAFGDRNVAVVEKIFQIIETTRGFQKYEGDFAAQLPAAREAHELAQQIAIPENFQPAFPMVISPEDLKKELLVHTETIVRFLEFSAAASEIEEMLQQEVSEEIITTEIEKLPEISAPTEWMTNYEYVLYLQKLKELKKSLHSS